MKLHHLLLFLFSALTAALPAQTTEPPLLNNKFSVWSQRLDMSAYIGQKYRLTVAIRAEPAKRKAAAQAFIRNEPPEGGYQNWTFMDNMNARPVRSQEWQTYTLEGRVEKDAPWLGFGFLSLHNGAFTTTMSGFPWKPNRDSGRLCPYPTAILKTNPSIHGSRRAWAYRRGLPAPMRR
ncbi:MAG: hypothetical protein H6573_01510 [Lewinellaceae bacterium]|nr:hypothetical protein [Lewinellaceae bacterium]